VYDEGTIYRILLGSFKARQPMTLFKGVYPLYIDQDEERLYCYYAGGYATRAEADEAQQQLRERGFRAPQICRWVDGEMTNLTLAEAEDEGAAVVGVRYVVEISSDEPLSEEIHDMIGENGDGREISRVGDNMFVVGTYSDRDVADRLAELISEADPMLDVKVSEIVLE
ncbi:MAG: SPOR domain-containing protein, partial [Alistipes sp.]|nr:SPOR domain-containing protein [Alistipes sp.]